MSDRVRRAEGRERGLLEALQLRASLVLTDYRDALLRNPDAIDLPVDQIDAGHVYVFERDDMVIGFVVVLPRADGQADLDGLFVEPDHWRSGVGRRLVQAAQAVAANRGASQLYVVASPQAQAFYEAYGFRACGVEQTRFGVAVGMKLLL
ncbi:MAG: GNAT family N-acetyltransferase [Proteobacteria bacterium]|nr:GNAT family N-acetyltransferase [Pseudomonadota bacterium]